MSRFFLDLKWNMVHMVDMGKRRQKKWFVLHWIATEADKGVNSGCSCGDKAYVYDVCYEKNNSATLLFIYYFISAIMRHKISNKKPILLLRSHQWEAGLEWTLYNLWPEFHPTCLIWLFDTVKPRQSTFEKKLFTWQIYFDVLMIHFDALMILKKYMLALWLTG